MKILADKEASGGGPSRLQGQVAAASQFFESWAGVRFRVVAVEAWEPEGQERRCSPARRPVPPQGDARARPAGDRRQWAGED